MRARLKCGWKKAHTFSATEANFHSKAVERSLKLEKLISISVEAQMQLKWHALGSHSASA